MLDAAVNVTAPAVHWRPASDQTGATQLSVAGSGDKQAKAELRHFEIDEVAVAFGPVA